MSLLRSLQLRVRPHPGQEAVLNSSVFCTAAIAGTGGGKTVNGMVKFLMWMVERPGMVWVVAEPTSDMVQRILLTPAPGRMTLPELLRPFDRNMVYLKSRGMIRHKLGTVIFATGEKPESLQGTQCGGIWLDEAGLMKREVWLTAVQRVGFYGGKLLLTTTPYDLGWLKREVYDVAMAGDPDYTVVNFPSTANPKYPLESLERARRTMSEARFRMMYEGKFTKAEGLVYDCFEDDRNLVNDFPIPAEWERLGGLDFGFNNPTAGAFLAKNPDGVYYLYDEHYKREDVIARHAQALIGKGGGRFVWQGDPSAAQSILEMRRLGVTVIEAVNAVRDGVDTVYGLLKTGRLKVFKSCKAALDEFGSYQWKRVVGGDRFSDEPVKDNDHLMDAIRYALHAAEKGSRLTLHV